MDCPTNTPLVRKLGIKAGHRVLALDEPAGFRRLLAELPAEVVLYTEAEEGDDPFDVILFFVHELAKLRRRLTPSPAV